ncbi:MAG: CvpA family protein [Oscillospiraceae bacterium]|nr:CvpA family protein [Oscillospiraceae bacterium]
MDPIKVDFTGGSGSSGGSGKSAVILPSNPVLKQIIAIVCAIVGGAIAYYFMLPAFNFKAIEMYEFFGTVLLIYFAVLLLLSGAMKNPEYVPYIKKRAIVPIVIAAVGVLIVLVGYIVSSVFFRADSYSKIISVDENKTFASDIKEVDFSAVPVLDNDAAAALAKRTLGDIASIGKISQFEVAGDFTQINYKNRPVRVTTLAYGDIFKWFKNTSSGFPGYIVVDMVTQKAEFVTLKEGSYMRYSPYEHFSKYLMRHLRFEYPTYMFGTPTFEIDESGKPYWICPVVDKTIGLFGGTDVKGAVLVDAVTGDFAEYTVDQIKNDANLQWIDGIYSSQLLVEQYNYYGRYSGGFWNSVIGQSGVKGATEGSNYLALNDDVYMYTGVTSAGNDEAIIGFVLINMRTKEANFYKISGAKEYSAAKSAQGAVQNFKYTATFPILLNIGGQPTYFMSLKDDSNLVKMYAMVNVEQYQVVVTGTKISDCTENYMNKLKENGINISVDIDNIKDEPTDEPAPDASKDNTETVKGKVSDIRTAVIGGESYYYIKLDSSEPYYYIKASADQRVVILNKGDSVEITFEKSKSELIEIKSIKIK